MTDADKSMGAQVQKHLRTRLVSGVLVLVPLAVTYFILRVLFHSLTSFMLPLLKPVLGHLPDYVLTLIALVATVALVYVVGLITTHFVGRRIIHLGESIILKVPIAKSIYAASKQVVDTFSAGNRNAFKAVVMVDFPHAGSQVIGFATGTFTDTGGRSQYCVFVPTTPNPTSGFLLIFPADQVRFTDLSVEDGIKMIVSGGVLVPPRYAILPPPAV
ncbi:MAG: DUF502 domain-containing protein [Lentisphaerae bacterium]|nr:DUF502 domain-containing protein [Lentisphaerota bacterium]